MVQQREVRTSRRIGVASRIELEFFCRNCKGHYSTTVPAGAVSDARCRCGSDNLLVYNLAGEYGAPLRYR
jgi:hypothetical protein